MSGLRIFAVFVIFVGASLAWMVLGGSIEIRTNDAGSTGHEMVDGLWGGPQVQQAPRFAAGKKIMPIGSSDITAEFKLDQRRKGLLWYATYAVDFDAEYGVTNDDKTPAAVRMTMDFPDPSGVYDGFVVRVDGRDVPVRYDGGSAIAEFEVPAGSTARVQTGYRTQGLDEWRYSATQGVGVVDDFTLTMTTDFEQIDFPADAVSPSGKERAGDGWELEWSYESLVSGRPVGLTMPKPLNPGPVASRISFFAPVSLLFYFAAMLLVTATRRVSIHPMNFGFLAAGFFAFHLLFAYLVDRIDIWVAFGIASAVSVGLCIGYLRLAVSDKRTLAEAAIGQLIFLVLFSFSFFFEGFTGLAITIGAVLTLAYFMWRTGRVNWDDVFARSAQEKLERRLAAIE